MGMVIDASVTLTWLFQEEGTTATRRVLRQVAAEGAIAPAHWWVEVVNAVLSAERRGRVDRSRSERFLIDLERLRIKMEAPRPSRSRDRLVEIARSEKLTSYDAAYLELAQRTGLPLATLDEDLRRAGALAGVLLLGR